ncbi:MAG: hypothetical protein P8164_02485 [Gammaproteobacteria bacterium]|jgi:hypothetical protein
MLKTPPLHTPIIIDVEASGFGRGSYPIEVGVAMEDGSTRCFLIRPATDWTHWDSSAESMHGISRELLIKHGQAPREVAEQLNELLLYKLVYSDAWGHDQSWLALLFETAGLPRRFRVESLRCLLEEDHLDYWQAEKAAALHTLENIRHRASNDALVLQRTLLGTLAHKQAVAIPPTYQGLKINRYP